jgi:hypothetical protein
MKNDTMTWVLVAVVAIALYYFVLRKPVAAVATATTIPTGAGATPYTGGGVPIAAGTYTQPSTSGNSTGSILAGVGGLLGGLGSLSGSVINSLGGAGVFDSSSSSDSSDDSDY